MLARCVGSGSQGVWARRSPFWSHGYRSLCKIRSEEAVRPSAGRRCDPGWHSRVNGVEKGSVTTGNVWPDVGVTDVGWGVRRHRCLGMDSLAEMAMGVAQVCQNVKNLPGSRKAKPRPRGGASVLPGRPRAPGRPDTGLPAAQSAPPAPLAPARSLLCPTRNADPRRLPPHRAGQVPST